MRAVLQSIRILVIILLIKNIRCQDGYSERDILRLQQMAANEGQFETITSYSSSNIMQRDPSSQSFSSVSLQYQTDDTDKSSDYNRADRGRNRKVYRIKNPFQRQLDLADERQQDSTTTTQDSDAGASNQYPSMQYSLPPEEFLQQMRAEQYYQQQQQQQQQQISTPSPNIGYTATPQPQYQYSTVATSAFDGNQQSNQVSQLEPKISNAQSYRSISNSYQYNGPNSYAIDTVQSTLSPLAYLSTPLPQSPYVDTQSNSYVSSSSPIYLSSPPNIQQYVSSPISTVQAGTPDYNNKISSTIGSNSINYDNSEQIKKMQIDHYDNSAVGIRYPINMQHYQNDYPSSTVAPSSTPYPEAIRESWQNNMNGISSVSKSIQEVSVSPYQKYQYNRNPQDNRQDQNSETSNMETNRYNTNMPSANNVYLNYAQPDYQALSNIRTRSRDVEHEISQPEFYSHGEYGWKLTEKKPASNGFSSGSYPRYQGLRSQMQNDGVAVSQMSFHMDTSKPQHQNYDHISKSSTETSDAQEFAKAAARAHEELKQRQQFFANDYTSSYSNNPYSGLTGNSYYGHNDIKQRNKFYGDNRNTYFFNGAQQDLITASPYYFASSRENPEEKPKQPFDHDKALKNIVSIDVSNVVANSDNQQKLPSNFDNGKYNQHFFGKDQVEQNLKQSFKSITDSYYQDKNAAYGLNIKPKPDEIISPEGMKLLESNYYGKQPTQEQFYSPGSYSDNKRYIDAASQSENYLSQVASYQDSMNSPANIQPQEIQRPQNQQPSDIASILKLNDIPYKLIQGLPIESFRSHNGNYEPVGLPTPLPPRLNQNIGSHQLDVASSILNKLILNKPSHSTSRPDIDSQSGSISTINGFKVANPFNVDLKLVADMLKGKPAIDEGQMLGFRDQFNKPPPLKIDISQLQQLLLKSESPRSLSPLNDGFGAYSSPYFEIYNSGGHPYQGVKYSRSQEEEESIVPIADSSNTHPIGAVIEQDDSSSSKEVISGSDLTGQDEEAVPEVTEERQKNKYTPNQSGLRDRYRHPNPISNRHSYQRKYPKTDAHEPYPLLKPPPPFSRNRGSHKIEKYSSRKRRFRRPKMVRVMKSEPLYEADTDDEADSTVSTLLQPPSPIAEAKSDREVVNDEGDS